MPFEGTLLLLDLLKTVEREATTGSLKTRSVRSRVDKAFMVKKDDFMHSVHLQNWTTTLRKVYSWDRKVVLDSPKLTFLHFIRNRIVTFVVLTILLVLFSEPFRMAP
jgi:hypothetical protein